jgi:hypothetical protein
VAGSVYFRLDYGPGHVQDATLPVKTREPRKLQDILQAEVKTTLSSLYEYQTGKVHIQLVNQSREKLKVTGIRPVGFPDFIRFVPQERSLDLEPFATAIATFDVSTTGRLATGRYLLLFNIDFLPAAGLDPHRRNLVVTKEVDVGVVGESDLLKLLGVPSFLCLPGCLAIWTWGLLWKMKLFHPATQFELTFGKPEFWLLSLTISGVIAWIYPRLGGANYLRGYDLSTIAQVWILSVTLGGACYSGYTGWKDYQSWKATRLEKGRQDAIRARTPSPGDDPITLLRKLGLQRLGLTLRRGKWHEATVYVVENDNGQSPLWVARQILLEWNDHATSKSREIVEGLLDREADPADLAATLETAREEVSVRWANDQKPGQAFREELELAPAGRIIAQI